MKHVTIGQGYVIESMLRQKKSQKEIAKAVGVSKSTISREIRRNRGKEGYVAESAQKKRSEEKN